MRSCTVLGLFFTIAGSLACEFPSAAQGGEWTSSRGGATFTFSAGTMTMTGSMGGIITTCAGKQGDIYFLKDDMGTAICATVSVSGNKLTLNTLKMFYSLDDAKSWKTDCPKVTSGYEEKLIKKE